MEQCTSTEHGGVVPTTVAPSAVAAAVTLIPAENSTAGFRGYVFDKRLKRNFFNRTLTVCLDTADRVTGNIQSWHDNISCDSNGIMSSCYRA